MNSKKRGATPRHATKPPQWMNNTGGLKTTKPTTQERPKKMLDLIWNILTTGSTISTIHGASPVLSAVLSY